MGAVDSRPLTEVSKEDVANHLISCGPGFQGYTSLVDDNGIDGALLSEMDDQGFLETLDDVGIVDQSHRKRLLEEFQIHSTAHTTTPVIRPAQSPIHEVFVSDLFFPSPMGAASKLSTFHLDHPNRATEAEQSHLVPNFYDKVDSFPGAIRPPIAKDDMDRVALVESYKLEEIEPDSAIAQKIVGLVQMAMNLFDVDLGDITFLNNECQYSFARVGLTQHMEDAIVGKVYETVSHSADGKPFLCKTERSIGICNYPTYSRRTFVVQDILLDDAFRWMRAVWPFRCYVGAPLMSASGVVIGTLCMHNLEPRPDFDRACEIQLEQVANMIVQSIENWKLQRNITVLESTRLSLQSTKDKSKPPHDKAVVCFIGIEECETLNNSAPKQMVAGLEVYHRIVDELRNQYFGYEVSKKGKDRYFLVFHDAVDAFGFALNLQQRLFDADWTDDFLLLPRVGDSGTGFRGLRVKVGAYMGNVNAIRNMKTGKTEYQSVKDTTIGIAKTLYHMAHGGQILTIFETWNVASFLAESKLDSPQVVDLGEHVIRTGKNTSDGVIAQRIVQLVPAALAIDYGEVATGKLNDSGANLDVGDDCSIGEDLGKTPGLWGRHFLTIKSEKKLSPSFFDAPGFNNTSQPTVTIAFIGTNDIEKRYSQATELVARIISMASSALLGTRGYQCQNKMLAFPNLTAAIDFGINFSEMLKQQEPLEDGANLGNLITYGCVHDSFITLEPHKTTGRADYFGKVVNRAARVAYISGLGTVCAGVTVTPEFDHNSFFAVDPSIMTRFVGRRKLKGVEGEVAVFECSRRLRRHHRWLLA